MKPKEVTDRLGITRDRIKYYKKQGVFQPDIPSRGRANYTESDVKMLRKLEVLTKAGVSCAPIKRIQGGSLTLTQAMKECQKSMYEEKKRIEGSLMLLELMMNDEADYDSLDTDYYWNFIEDKKREGIVFLENPEMDFMPVSMERSITCPCCGDTQEVDLVLTSFTASIQRKYMNAQHVAKSSGSKVGSENILSVHTFRKV